MSDGPKSLGDYFANLELTDSECARISKAMADKGQHFEILKKYAVKTPPYLAFQKRERIPGFRPGTSAYDSHAIAKVAKYIVESKNGGNKIAWDILRASAIRYVNVELPRLDELLREVKTTPSNDREAFSLLCSNAGNYDVTVESIRHFYEIWWTERLSDLDSIISNCANTEAPSFDRRALKKLSDQVAQLREKLDSHLSTKAEQDQAIQALGQSQKKFSNVIEELQEATQSSTSELRSIATEVGQKIDAKFSQLESRFQSFNERFKTMDAKLSESANSKETKQELKRVSEEMRAISRSVNNSIQDIRKQLASEIESASGTFEAKLGSLKKELQRLKDSSSLDRTYARTKSPLAGALNGTANGFKINTESDFINSWISSIHRSATSNLQYAQVAALHSVILANNTIIADEHLAKTWIECLGWQALSLNIATSPIWTSEDDWMDGLNFLSEALGANPRILLIHNYDVALVDAFLVPSLKLWSIKNPESSFSKIFLIPSNSNEPAAASVLEFAATVALDESFEKRLVTLKSNVKTPSTLRGEIPTGVDPKTATQWLCSEEIQEFDFNMIQRALGFEFTPQLLANFRRTIGVASRFLEDSQAMESGFHHIVLPWVQAKYGDESYNDLSAYLKQIADMRS